MDYGAMRMMCFFSPTFRTGIRDLTFNAAYGTDAPVIGVAPHSISAVVKISNGEARFAVFEKHLRPGFHPAFKVFKSHYQAWRIKAPVDLADAAQQPLAALRPAMLVNELAGHVGPLNAAILMDKKPFTVHYLDFKLAHIVPLAVLKFVVRLDSPLDLRATH